MNQVVKIFVALATVVALTNAQGYCVYSSIFSLRASNAQAELDTVSNELEEAIANLNLQPSDANKLAFVDILRFTVQITREIPNFLNSYQTATFSNVKICQADFLLLLEALEEVLDDIVDLIRAWIVALPNLTESDAANALPGFGAFVYQFVSIGSKTNNALLSLFGYLVRDTTSQYPSYYGTWPTEADNLKMNLDALTSQAPRPPTPAPLP